MAKKEFTVRQVFEALKENGFTHLRKRWFAEDMDGVNTGACVLGQAALNLGVYGTPQINKKNDDYLKDSIDTNLQDQLNKAITIYPGHKWYVGDFGRTIGAGSLIIYWNDKTNSDNPREYALPTYEDVVTMAHEILEPYFDEKITLGTRKWKFKKLETTP